jgi:hypothetical protein
LAKNFAQIQRHAREVVAKWAVQSPDVFLDCVAQLASATQNIRIVLSSNHESLFNEIVRGAAARGMDPNDLECAGVDHFELIGPAFLKTRLEGLHAVRHGGSRGKRG